MTLKELREQVGSMDMTERLPYPTTLIKSGKEPVVEKSMGGDSLVAVFEEGYVLYVAGVRATVFRLSGLDEDYTYENLMDVKGSLIGAEDLENFEWDIALTLIGEDRIWDTMKTCDSNQNVISYSGIGEDWGELIDENADIFKQIILKEDLQELQFLLSLATYKQRQALITYFECNENASWAARVLGISRQSLTELVAAGIKRINDQYYKRFHRKLRGDI